MDIWMDEYGTIVNSKPDRYIIGEDKNKNIIYNDSLALYIYPRNSRIPSKMINGDTIENSIKTYKKVSEYGPIYDNVLVI